MRSFAFAAAALISLSASQGREFSEEDRAHWAFQPVKRVSPPEKGPSHPIDAFLSKELLRANLSLSVKADKRTLIRRAYLDLIGIPPTPAQVEAFLADNSSEAWKRVIEELLASPKYGERWARHWLDLARYAESEGFKADETRPNAWRYRDYVIASLNADKPYDRFVAEQIAGDELWPESAEARIATGFNRHYPDESNARNLMQRRQDILNDITDTAGAVFTGLTYACARCHDHKFDPILQKDYFRLQAFFANVAARDNMPLADENEIESYASRLERWEALTADIRRQMAELEEKPRRAMIKDYVDKYPEQVQAALNKPAHMRTPFEQQMVAKAELYIKPDSHQYLAHTKAVVGKLKGEEKKRWEELNAELQKYADLHPGQLPVAQAMADLSPRSPDTRLLRKGNWDSPREVVEPGFLTILDPAPAAILPPPNKNSTGRRAALAKILTSPENPLTARVMANRIWQHHFGTGIVGTSSDFGLKGDRPTHPQLLDWLASEFVRQGWSIKSMHRLIMTSAAYQQSSAHYEGAAKADPENKLLSRFPRHRLEGEVIRDSALAVAGLLNERVGGPSVFPELPDGMVSRGGWDVSDSADDRNRRSVYVFVRRNTRYPLFETFDMPDTHESCARRNVTTSPVQALTMLNSKMTLEWAQAFAGKVMRAAGPARDAQIEAAFQMAFSRQPQLAEKALIREFLERQKAIVKERSQDAPLALPRGAEEKLDPAEGAALVDFCHMLLNANEFVYLN